MNSATLIQGLLQSISFLFVYNVATDFFVLRGSKIDLEKLSKYDGFVVKDLSLSDCFDIEELKQSIDSEKLKQFLFYLEKLKDYTSEENLITVYKNLNTAKIKKNRLILLFGNAGIYDPKENIVKYSVSSSIGHEFLHLSSAYYNSSDDLEIIGFKQMKKNLSIGYGLNEGYTELLASRIYNNGCKVPAYKNEVKIARLFELFFDDYKTMEKYYFHHDLPAFIRYMETFIPHDEIIKIIYDIDKIKVTGNTINFAHFYYSIKVQITLYHWFIINCRDQDKIKLFQDLICENPIISAVIHNKKYKLCKENFYDSFNSMEKESKHKLM